MQKIVINDKTQYIVEKEENPHSLEKKETKNTCNKEEENSPKFWTKKVKRNSVQIGSEDILKQLKKPKVTTKNGLHIDTTKEFYSPIVKIVYYLLLEVSDID